MCTLILFVYCLNLFIFFHFLSQNYFYHGFIDLQYIVQGMLIQILSETKKNYKIIVISQMKIPIYFPIIYNERSSFFNKSIWFMLRH